MSEPEFPDSIEEVLDSIAEIVPEDRRVAYYRDMRHLHLLPKSDEMLHILKVIGWTVVIMVQVPLRIAAEIAKLDRVLRDHFEAQQRIDQRLEHVFQELIERVSAERIANQLCESLRQQFVKLALPRTGKALVTVANDIRQTVARLEEATPRIAAVTDTAHRAIAELSQTSVRTDRWTLIVFLVVAVFLGFFGGILVVQSGFLAR